MGVSHNVEVYLRNLWCSRYIGDRIADSLIKKKRDERCADIAIKYIRAILFLSKMYRTFFNQIVKHSNSVNVGLV